MTDIVGVRFKKAGKIYYFDPGDFKIEGNTNVIVETARGIEFGNVVIEHRKVSDEELVLPLKKVIRIATKEDEQHSEENRKKEIEAINICVEKIKKHNLDMKLIDVEYTFDNNKILFYFTADGRIDFRELVKDLASVFKTRIELRQIGVRDESKMMGGLGVCGRMLCCNSFLGEFEPVSIKMAKEQGLSLNPAKISGCCGRLMCCLKYEQNAYDELIRKTPGMGAIVETPDGQGTVVAASLLKESLKVVLDKDNDKNIKIYSLDQVKIIKNVNIVDESAENIDGLNELEDLL